MASVPYNEKLVAKKLNEIEPGIMEPRPISELVASADQSNKAGEAMWEFCDAASTVDGTGGLYDAATELFPDLYQLLLAYRRDRQEDKAQELETDMLNRAQEDFLAEACARAILCLLYRPGFGWPISITWDQLTEAGFSSSPGQVVCDAKPGVGANAPGYGIGPGVYIHGKPDDARLVSYNLEGAYWNAKYAALEPPRFNN